MPKTTYPPLPALSSPPPTPLTATQVAEHPAFGATEWKLEPTSSGKTAVAKGRNGGPFDLWWEIHGKGEVKVVWIMGLGAYRTAWKRQTKYFGHTNSSTYSSLIYDNRGMGLSAKPSTRYSTTEMAKDLVDLLISINWLSPATPTRNLNIIGVSMGGMIAQEIGLLIPASIQSLSLVSTAPRLVRTIPFVENLRQRINMFMPRDINVQLEEIAHRLFSSTFLGLPDHESPDPALNYPSVRDRFAAGELSKRADRDGFTKKGFVLQAIAAGWHHKTPGQLAEMADKVGRERICVMHGTEDRMITFHHFELFEKELGDGVDLRVWEGAGHVLMWEREEEFNEAVRELIERCGGSA